MGLQRVLGLGGYLTAWIWFHKLGRAMVRPGRDALTGTVAVDETYVGGLAEGRRGRGADRKTLVVIAAGEDGKGIGLIRMSRVADASAGCLQGFMQVAVASGSRVHTDGWDAYAGLSGLGYTHQVSVLQGQGKSASDPAVASRASAGRRLWTEPQVFFMIFMSSNYLNSFMSLSVNPVLPECSGDLIMAENQHVMNRNAAKAQASMGFLCSTAGGRELGLKARPPARLTCWRTPSLIGRNGLLPVD